MAMVTSEITVTEGEPIRCLITSGNEAVDTKLFWQAVKLGVGRLIVIGPIPAAVKEANEAHGMEVEFYPQGAVPPTGTNAAIFDATKWGQQA